MTHVFMEANPDTYSGATHTAENVNDEEKVLAQSKSKALRFFNTHEFLVHDNKLCVTHHCNNHFLHDQDIYRCTRIVRVPRIYDQSPLSDMIPRFSLFVPGTEPAALTNGVHHFEPSGTYEGEVFGAASWSPLVPGLISESAFKSIVAGVNSYIQRAFDPYEWRNAVENLAEILTGGLYSRIYNKYVQESYHKRVMTSLEEYIQSEVNSKILKNTGVVLISPSLSGFLSVRSPRSISPPRLSSTNNPA